MTKNAGKEMVTICLRVEKSEKARWRDRAKKADMSLTKLMRLTMNNSDVTVAVSVSSSDPGARPRAARQVARRRVTQLDA